MKNKYLVILAICFSVSLAFLVPNKGQNPQWKGPIKEVKGIKVVNNPRKPLYGEYFFCSDSGINSSMMDIKHYKNAGQA